MQCAEHEGLVKEFESTVNPLMTCILKNLNETRTLKTLRDGLLPKLVSGELRVDMEKVTDDVV